MKKLLLGFTFLLLSGCGAAQDGFSDTTQEIYFPYAGPQEVVSSCGEQAENLEAAVNFWNDALGEEVFRVSEEGFPILCFDNLGGNLGVAALNREHSTCNYVLVNPRSNEYVIAHELGHCAGLGHSYNRASIMFTNVPNGGQLSEEIYNHFEVTE